MKEIKVKITFTEEVLGTLPADENLYKTYIVSKSPDAKSREEEIAAAGVEEYTEKTLTVFARDPDKNISIYDYQMRGFFKEMCGICSKIPGNVSAGIKAYKKLIDNYIFVKERFIKLDLHGEKTGICERPLRASTMQGERIALAMSETVPAGTTAEFTVILTAEKSAGKKDAPAVDYTDALKEWLEYGKFKGFGQWRNSGKGIFTYEIIE